MIPGWEKRPYSPEAFLESWRPSYPRNIQQRSNGWTGWLYFHLLNSPLFILPRLHKAGKRLLVHDGVHQIGAGPAAPKRLLPGTLRRIIHTPRLHGPLHVMDEFPPRFSQKLYTSSIKTPGDLKDMFFFWHGFLINQSDFYIRCHKRTSSKTIGKPLLLQPILLYNASLNCFFVSESAFVIYNFKVPQL